MVGRRRRKEETRGRENAGISARDCDCLDGPRSRSFRTADDAPLPSPHPVQGTLNFAFRSLTEFPRATVRVHGGISDFSFALHPTSPATATVLIARAIFSRTVYTSKVFFHARIDTMNMRRPAGWLARRKRSKVDKSICRNYI